MWPGRPPGGIDGTGGGGGFMGVGIFRQGIGVPKVIVLLGRWAPVMVAVANLVVVAAPATVEVSSGVKVLG